MAVEPLSIKKTFRTAWELVKREPGLWVKVLGTEFGISLAASIISNVWDNSFGQGVNLLAQLVNMYLMAGIVMLTKRVLAGESVKYTDIFRPQENLISYFLTVIVTGIITVVGVIFLIIPGIILSLIYGYAHYVALTRHVGVGEALKEAAALTKGNRMKLFLLVLAIMGLNILGFMALIVGVFITAPFSGLVMIVAYFMLEGEVTSMDKLPTKKVVQPAIEPRPESSEPVPVADTKPYWQAHTTGSTGHGSMAQPIPGNEFN